MKKTLLILAAAMVGLTAGAQNVLLNEDFEGVTVGSNGVGAVPAGWTTYEDDLDNYSNSQQSLEVYGKSWCTMHDDYGNMAISISYTMQGTQCDRWLITPQISVPSTGFALTWWQYGSQYYENLQVKISTTGTEKTDFVDVYGEYPVYNGNRVVNLDQYSGEQIYIAFVNNGTDALYVGVDDIRVADDVPADSITYAGMIAPKYAASGSNFNVVVGTMNCGRDTLRAVDIEYSVGTNAPQTKHVTGISVAPNTYYIDTLTMSYATLGEATIMAIFKNPNGSSTGFAATPGTSTITIYDPAAVAERSSLLEHFTTAQCVWCPYGHERMTEGMQGHEERVAWVSHHVGYYTDFMTLNESNQIANMFGIGGAPQMMIDRVGGSSAIGSVGEATEISQQLSDAYAAPAFVTISISNLNYDAQTRELSLTVSGEFKADYAQKPNLTLWITEDSIIGEQKDAYRGNLTNYEHNHVLRALPNGIWGENSAFDATTSGSTYSKTYTYTLPSHIRANKARVIAFVNNYGNAAADREVQNVAKTGYLLEGPDPTVAGITAVEAAIGISTYPNPTTDMAYITAEGQTIRAYSVVNSIGQKVMGNDNACADIIELNVSGLAEGVYFVTVRTDKGTATERMTVVR